MSYRGSNVRCPFYKDDTPCAIKCEGLVSQVCAQNFSTRDEKIGYMRRYCECDYTHCIIAQKIEEKYK